MMKRQLERLDELSKPDDILYEDRLDKLTSSFERFFGTLKNEQLIFLEAYAQETLYDRRIRLNNNTQRQKAFVEFLKTEPTEEELTVFLNKLLIRGHEITNSDYQDFAKISLERFQELLLNILTISSKKQKDKLISKILDYAEDFKIVSR